MLHWLRYCYYEFLEHSLYNSTLPVLFHGFDYRSCAYIAGALLAKLVLYMQFEKSGLKPQYSQKCLIFSLWSLLQPLKPFLKERLNSLIVR